jgi:hypothetical protein
MVECGGLKSCGHNNCSEQKSRNWGQEISLGIVCMLGLRRGDTATMVGIKAHLVIFALHFIINLFSGWT